MKYMQHIDKLDFPDIPIHVQVGGIPKFDTRNDISIYVFGYEKRETHPLHLTLLALKSTESAIFYW